ncbi:MAG: glycosyltransferase family 39 protein [Xanthomonadaceae bacterium]|nr:glycosyltransferase family 39 protein [Xanthomonadaceae bacterium]
MTWIKISGVAFTVLMISLAFLLFLSEGHFYITTKILPRATVWSLYISTALISIGLAYHWRITLSPIIQSKPITRLALLLILIFSTVFLKNYVPQTNRVYFDEHIYENIGQLIHTTGESLMVNQGTIRQGKLFAQAREYNKQPGGYPTYLSYFFSIFNVSEATAFFAVNCAYFFTILLIFCVYYLLFQSELGALYSALFFSLTPMVMRFANTAAVEIPTVLFSTLTIYCALIYRQLPSWFSGASLIGSLGFTFQMRGESPLMLIPVLLILYPALKTELKINRFYILLPALTVLLLPVFLHILSFRNHSWGNGTGEKFSLDAFKMNSGMNIPFYFTNVRFPIFFTICALFGLFFRAKKNKIELLSVWTWFILTFGIFLFFYAGGYNYGIDVRYSVISAPALAILSGFGANRIIEVLTQNFKAIIKVAPLAMLILIVSTWATTLEEVTLLGQEAVQARLDVSFSREVASKISKDALIFSHNPSMWLILGVSSAQSSILSHLLDQPLILRNQIRVWRKNYPGGIFFHWNFWCNTMDKVQVTFCQKIINGFKHKKVFEQVLNNKPYSVYEILDY